MCRSDRWLSADLKRKIALFCNVAEGRVISAQDVDTIYAVPVELAREGLDDQLLQLLHMEAPPRHFEKWMNMLDRMRNPEAEVKIAVVGNILS